MDNKIKGPELLYQIIYDATKDKFGILPILAGLILAVVALGISGDLFPLNDNIRYIATILLLLMMLSIQIYYSETIGLLTKAQKEFDAYFGRETSNPPLSVSKSIRYLFTGKINGLKKEGDFFDRFSSQFPAFAILILWFVIFFVIYQIWCG